MAEERSNQIPVENDGFGEREFVGHSLGEALRIGPDALGWREWKVALEEYFTVWSE